MGWGFEVVLESWDSLRTTGFVLNTRTNAWKALEAIGVADALRLINYRFRGSVAYSTISGLPVFGISFKAKGKEGDHEARCVQRRLLLESLANELPSGTTRFSSKVVSIEESGYFKLLHLADGTILKVKRVLVGCDGVNSVVGKWLNFKQLSFTGKSTIRGQANFKSNHGFDPKSMRFFEHGVRSGVIPCDKKRYRSLNLLFTAHVLEKGLEENPAQLRQFVLSKLGKIPDAVRATIENTELDAFILSPLRYKPPWEVLWGQLMWLVLLESELN
ncbi:monooxygenase 3-like [Rosa rugosa]|uniref:monooxygenase 3-like n=1 Tax=Rosa rugosa TaxID=74645 RepID=UPI002B40EE59|nr:monooxygenase 3-like [Rosa rugosa]